MPNPIQVRRLIEFREFPLDWTLIRVFVHWNGDPILLFEEGRPPFPLSRDWGDVQRWYSTDPVAHHIVHLQDDIVQTIDVPSAGVAGSTQFAQPFLEDWLLADSRGGRARIVDWAGTVLRVIDLGDAIEDIQVTKDGSIWTSYFDEGVFSRGIGTSGLICFNTAGTPTFRYNQFAEAIGLPDISDCYALNVRGGGQVWLTYYTDFPLICIKNFELESRWELPSAIRAFAVRHNSLLYARAYECRSIFSFDLNDKSEIELDPIDEQGEPLRNFKGRNYAFFASDEDSRKRYHPFRAVGRHAKLYLYTEEALYEVPE